MTDDELRDAYRTLQARRRAARTARGDEAPAPEVLWQAVSGEASEEVRVRVLDDALRAGASDDVALVQAMHAAAQTTAERTAGNTTARPARTNGRWWSLAAAAAVLLAVGLPTLRDRGASASNETEPTRYRDDSLGEPSLIAPAADTPIATDGRFVWRTFTDARDYRLEALDAEGRVVFAVTTPDTAVALPATITADERARITGWWVTATRRDGQAVRSALRLVAPGQRP